MQWAKIVDEPQEGKAYFVGKVTSMLPNTPSFLLIETANGKQKWGVKPSMAIRAEYNDKLRQWLAGVPGSVLVEIPADADKRWRRRV